MKLRLPNNNYDYDLDYLKDEFNYEIIKRGEDYYESNHVLKCYKNNYKYYAKVSGNNGNEYDVEIDLYNLEMHCNCPCTFPCKHEYAVILAIENHDYENISLKPEVRKIEYDFKEIIKKIPANNLKKYLLSSKSIGKVYFETTTFNEYFINYLPKQKYIYYYNNLYNSISINSDYLNLLERYLEMIKLYIDKNEFNEGFKIIKSIIDSFKDTKRLDNEYFINKMPLIGMYFRIIYRHASPSTKNLIDDYIEKLINNNYYSSYYLEDIFNNYR